ncbi:5142_t:CDS:2, partial [Gigaspora margarita]
SSCNFIVKFEWVVENKYDEFYLVDLNTEEEPYYALDKSIPSSRFKKQPTNKGMLRYCFSMDDSISSSTDKRMNGKTLKDFLIEIGELKKNVENILLEINNALNYIIGTCNVEKYNKNIRDIKSVKLLTQNKEFDIGTTLSQIAIALNAGEHIYDKFKAHLYDMHLSNFLENIQPEFSLLFYPVTEPPTMNFRLKKYTNIANDILIFNPLETENITISINIKFLAFYHKASVIKVSNTIIDLGHHDAQWTEKIKSVAKIIKKLPTKKKFGNLLIKNLSDVDLTNSDDSEFIIQELSINLWAKDLKLGSLIIERNITNSVM